VVSIPTGGCGRAEVEFWIRRFRIIIDRIPYNKRINLVGHRAWLNFQD
jgi:hypothetical protein